MKIINTDYLFDEEQSSSVVGSHTSTIVTSNKGNLNQKNLIVIIELLNLICISLIIIFKIFYFIDDSKMVVPLDLSCNSDTKKETKKVNPGIVFFYLTPKLALIILI